LGALTAKTYPFRYRSWELLQKTVTDLSTPFGYKLLIEKRGNEIIRVLPHINYATNTDLITNTSRFSFDAEKQNRLKKIIKRIFFRENKKLLSIFKPVVLKKVLKELSHNINLSILFGKYNEIETIMSLKETMKKQFSSQNTSLYTAEKINTNSDFQRSYFNNLQNLKECDALFLIGCNPALEEPILAVHIKNEFVERQLDIYSFGKITFSGFSFINLGNSEEILGNIALGKNKLIQIFKKYKKPLFLIGNDKIDLSFLNLYQNQKKEQNTLYSKYLNKINKLNFRKESWNPLFYLYKGVGTLNALDIGGIVNINSFFDKNKQ